LSLSIKGVLKKIIVILFSIALIISCKKSDAPPCADCVVLYFKNPQPDKCSELDHFPSKFKGLYINDDSTFIRIEEDRILKEYFYKTMIHRGVLDSLKKVSTIVNGKLILKDFKTEYDLKPKGDSILLTQNWIDTLFRFSLNQKAKRIDGQLILSRKDSTFWNVEFLLLEKNSIKFKNIYEKKDLKKLDSVSKIKGMMLDSISYLLKPTRSEFKKILKIKNFGYDQEFRKVSKH